jgi:hypothetical protein
VGGTQQVTGTRTFEYALPANDVLTVQLMAENQHGHVSIEVYEDGALVAQDSDSSIGLAMVSYEA